MTDYINPSNDSSSLDKRYFPRWDVENRVLYKLQDEAEHREGKTSDISCAGACISIKERFFPQEKVSLVIYLSTVEFVEITGDVVWHKNYGLKSQIGVDFKDMDEKTQETLLSYAFEVNKADVVKHWFNGWKNDK